MLWAESIIFIRRGLRKFFLGHGSYSGMGYRAVAAGPADPALAKPIFFFINFNAVFND